VSWGDDPHQGLEMKKGVTVMVTPFGFVFPERLIAAHGDLQWLMKLGGEGGDGETGTQETTHGMTEHIRAVTRVITAITAIITMITVPMITVTADMITAMRTAPTRASNFSAEFSV
jgi:hypothetical protein